MWTSTVDLSPKRVILTNLLGRFWRGAYFSSFAPLRVQNVPRQSLPGAGWVRVRNRLAGICGSDLHLIYADGDLRVAPAALPAHAQTYLGHEVVGEVIEIGDEVQQLQVGDRVVLQHDINCLSAGVQPLCRSCASGSYGLCERGTLPDPHPIGGGWSEEMLLHEQQLFRVPSEMTDSQAVLLEPSAVAVHAVLRHVPQAGDRVLIIGAGTIGLLTLQIVRILAPHAEISVLARYPFQVEKATRMGAAHIIYSQDSYSGVQQATQAQLYTGLLGNQMLLGGYDVIYDTIGSQSTIHNALRWARAKATVVLVGLSLHIMRIDLTPVWYQEINLIGTLGQGIETWPLGTQEQRSTFSITADMMLHGLLRPEQLITHHFALNNYRQALMTAMDKREQRAIKVVFDYSLLPASVVPNVRASARQPRSATVDLTRPPTPTTRELVPKEVVQPLQKYRITPEPSAVPVAPEKPRQVHPSTAQVQPTQVQQEPPTTVEPTMAHTGAMSDTEQEQAITPIEAMPPLVAHEHHDTTATNWEETNEAIPVGAVSSTQVEPYAEAPLNELEWLDVVAQENVPQTISEEQTPTPSPFATTSETRGIQPGEAAYASTLDNSVAETASSMSPEEQNDTYHDELQDVPLDTMHDMNREYQEDIALEAEAAQEELQYESEDAQYDDPKEDFATNHTPESLQTTRTTKAINPGKQRSKNRNKGKNTTGSYRS